MSKKSIHIVGGGIIGLCTAWYLLKEGYQVTIIDKGDMKNGTSHGNAGMIVPSHFVPMASPGVITQGLKWLLDSKSPFYVKPRMNLSLFQWLWSFYRSSTKEKVNTAMPILYAFNERSKELYKEISEENHFDFSYEEKGLLMLFNSEKQAQKEEKLAAEAHKIGIKTDLLNYNQLAKLEPEMDLEALGGLYFPEDAHLYPNQFIAQLITVLKQNGVQFINETSIIGFKTTNSKISFLIDKNRNEIPVDNVLLATGSWSAYLLKKLGIKLLLEDGKGYSITLNQPKIRPKTPTILAEAKVAITPMGDDVRIGGTLELSGLSNKIDTNRVKGIVESIPKYYKNWSVPYPHESGVWKGYRPCSPDGLPYIGKSNKVENLYIGTGHGMMGLSLGPATGKILSEIITQQKPFLDIELFTPERF